MQQSVLLFGLTVRGYRVSRTLVTIILALLLFAPLLATCGCGDLKGAARETAGQLSERRKLNKDATDVMDSGVKKQP